MKESKEKILLEIIKPIPSDASEDFKAGVNTYMKDTEASVIGITYDGMLVVRYDKDSVYKKGSEFHPLIATQGNRIMQENPISYGRIPSAYIYGVHVDDSHIIRHPTPDEIYEHYKVLKEHKSLSKKRIYTTANAINFNADDFPIADHQPEIPPPEVMEQYAQQAAVAAGHIVLPEAMQAEQQPERWEVQPGRIVYV